MGSQALSVTEVVLQIKETLEGDFQTLAVEGEISNLTQSAVGHWYFTLSDKKASLQVALFKGDAFRNPVIRKLKDGVKVICTGHLGVYTKRGTFQLICKTLVPTGKGDLKAQFEALKKQLAGEGLFDLDHKCPIPAYPDKVAIITSERGAALQDFLKIYRRRSLWMDITLIPVPVQGEKAPSAIIEALSLASNHNFDVIVLTRGGGAMEDLWAFNDESLAKAIYQCSIPVISAVGHEVDFTMTDYVADLRAETPSSAAQILTEPQTMILHRLQTAHKTLQLKMSEVIGRYRHQVAQRHPFILMQVIKDRVNQYQKRLEACHRLHHAFEIFRFHEIYLFLDELMMRALKVVEGNINRKGNQIERSWDLLNAFNVKKVLKRGFTYIKTENVVPSLEDFNRIVPGRTIDIHFYDGKGLVQKCEE